MGETELIIGSWLFGFSVGLIFIVFPLSFIAILLYRLLNRPKEDNTRQINFQRDPKLG